MLMGGDCNVKEISSSKVVADHVVTVTERDNNTTISLAKNDVLAVKLEAQLGTGYDWSFHGNDPKKLKETGKPEVESEGDGLPGKIEHEVFRFKAKCSGDTKLDFDYKRPFEKDEKPLKTFHIKVTIK
ncbi:MAG TPA: protease inhibitor I42 family protein [Gemmataceae bacterium]|nr:protease inhibitor I42 family protein [Gemmataceae bacterium]